MNGSGGRGLHPFTQFHGQTLNVPKSDATRPRSCRPPRRAGVG